MAAEYCSQPMSMNMSSNCQHPFRTRTRTRSYSSVKASQSSDDKDKFFKQLGMFSLRKKIEDIVLRAEMLGPPALQLEEDKRIRREEKIREYNLWDDPVKSDEMLGEFANSAKVVDALKDLRYKIEEAKLIKELAESDAVNYRLFKQAYMSSVDASNFLDSYQMSKLFRGSYDMHGASVVIKAGDRGIYSEIWAEQLLNMYIKWAEKKGHKGRVVDKYSSRGGGIKSATIEFEFEFAYGYLMGERGVHRMMGSVNGSTPQEASLAAVDVTPLFLDTVSNLALDDKDLIVSYTPSVGTGKQPVASLVRIQHIPTGINVESSGERNRFTNKAKALNRLKAKLLVIMSEQGICDVSSIERDAIVDLWKLDTRIYMLQPYKVVEDLKTGVQLPDINSVLDGNVDQLIGAHINIRHAAHKF
ncbi:peptide chain release factor PrfB3, chloroplastic isoform X1 [Silene latifolia]|uniref:peptide chain release factor PrfB3, chloroplastic isoform X1 n=2 Tax=Silene latifolia TaxID=37657 RepID=UPI003D781F59